MKRKAEDFCRRMLQEDGDGGEMENRGAADEYCE